MSNELIDNCFSDWKEREATAEAMIPLIGRLYRQNNVVTSIYGRAVINQSVIGILKSHRFVRQVEEKELSVHDTYAVLQVLDTLKLGHARIDIGKLEVRFKVLTTGVALEEYLESPLSGILGAQDQ